MKYVTCILEIDISTCEKNALKFFSFFLQIVVGCTTHCCCKDLLMQNNIPSIYVHWFEYKVSQIIKFDMFWWDPSETARDSVIITVHTSIFYTGAGWLVFQKGFIKTFHILWFSMRQLYYLYYLNQWTKCLVHFLCIHASLQQQWNADW